MEINIERRGHASRVLLRGRFDFLTHRSFRQTCDGVLEDGGVMELVVDFRNVSYLDSSALGMLLQLRDRAAHAKKVVRLANCRGTVADVLRVANFEKLFQME